MLWFHSGEEPKTQKERDHKRAIVKERQVLSQLLNSDRKDDGVTVLSDV